MGLSDAKVEPAVPVSDMAKAKEFYEGKLGLSGGRPIADGGITYPCGAGREFHIYPSPANAGKSGGTTGALGERFDHSVERGVVVALVTDLESTVDELTANGVSFEQVDSDRIKTNDKGIAELGDDRFAWFKDPDGNFHALVQL